MSNFTVDDTAGTLLYGPGWGISSADDASLGQYFQSTYHASQSVGAVVNLTFTGTAVYLYGSKGASHASYSVHYDNSVKFLSAASTQQQYRQLLFSSELPSGTHLLMLTNTDGLWLDLDSVTVTDGNFTSTTGFSSTIAPLVLATSNSSGISLSSSPSSTTNASSQAVSHTTTTYTATLVLAIVFGILLFCSMIAGLWFYLLNRSRISSRRARRPPSSSVNTRLPGSAFLASQDFAPAPPISPPGVVSDVISETAIQSPTSTSMLSPTSAHPWSPFSGPLKHVFTNAKSDGTDSTKSTFLKV
ncbi:hypothetical protein BU17DRAFT_87933 [Hysterangium stoloniferum]|nr:hypothetical protein BU17DRAFT_87933 [Hysterangium stoloniferum]